MELTARVGQSHVLCAQEAIDVLSRQMILYLVEMEALLQKGALTVMAVQLDPNVPLRNLCTTNSVQMVHIR